MAHAGKHGDSPGNTAGSPDPGALSATEVRAVANLARLVLNEAQVEACRAPMAAVLGYMDHLRSLDLTGVEPMSHPNDTVNRLDADEPRPESTLPTEALMRLAPAKHEPFVRVPGVFESE